MRQAIRQGVLCLGLVSGMAIAASAQSVLPSLDTIIRALVPEAAGPVVTQLSSTGAIPLAPTQPIVAGYDFPTFSLNVEFDEGGHLLTANGMTSLRAIAAALTDPKLAGSTFQVGGHTVQGNAVNALPVSSRRAQSVVAHLTTFYGVAPERLVAVGYGNTKLVDVTNPTSPVNERIELINIDALK